MADGTPLIFVGIDPGLAGGIAAIRGDGSVLRVTKMPASERDVYDAIMVVSSTNGATFAMIEKVAASPQMGVVSAFTFGRGYGGLRMAMVAARMPFDEITPQRWQRSMQCLTHGDKNVSKRRAQELFPHENVTHAIADALLLAEYCRRSFVRV